MKEYLENRIKSLSEQSAKLWGEYEKTTGAAKTALKYRECILLDERLAELNDVFSHFTAQLQHHGVVHGLAELSDEVLAEAFAILYGNFWKNYWPTKSKADEMRSIIKANNQPCRPFENWVRCIDFLMTQASPTVGRAGGQSSDQPSVADFVVGGRGYCR